MQGKGAEMKKVINKLRPLILTVMIIFVPILCMCSYLLDWDADIQYILLLLTVLEMIGIWLILALVED